MRAARLKLRIDAQDAGLLEIAELLPGAAETVHFQHRFASSGRHVVAVALDGRDDLSGDNQAQRVLDVMDTLSVLIVDGTPSTRPEEGAGFFLDVALSPEPEPAGGKPDAAAPAAGAVSSSTAQAE